MKFIAIFSVAVVALAAQSADAKFQNESSATFLAVLNKIRAGCPAGDGDCGTLAGNAIGGILAGAEICLQQDNADAIVDKAKKLGANGAALIAAAKEYRTHEKNTIPNFNVRVNGAAEDRKSLFCQKAPRNAELNGLVQDQSPTAANVFFDAANPNVDIKDDGTDARTKPVGGAAPKAPAAAPKAAAPAVAAPAVAAPAVAAPAVAAPAVAAPKANKAKKAKKAKKAAAAKAAAAKAAAAKAAAAQAAPATAVRRSIPRRL